VKNLIIVGFLLLTSMVSAQDQIKTQSGKVYNCEIANVDELFLYYNDSQADAQRIPIKATLYVFVADSIKLKTLLSKSTAFKAQYESQRVSKESGTNADDLPQLLNEAGRELQKGTALVLAGRGIGIGGGLVGVLVTVIDPITGFIIVGASTFVGFVIEISGHVKNLNAAKLLRQSGVAAQREKSDSK
jgi:hypothetical protein